MHVPQGLVPPAPPQPTASARPLWTTGTRCTLPLTGDRSYNGGVIPTFIVSPPGAPPQRLRPGSQLRIGRSSTNDIVLDSTQVSREHAILIWQAGAVQPSLVDLGSANGVVLDGVKVQGSRTLGAGGTIQIGEMRLTYSFDGHTSDLALAFNLPDDSESFVLERGEQFNGSFEGSEELQDILRGLERAKRSGALQFTSEGGKEGSLQFAQGKLMSASCGDKRGLAALESLLRLEAGSYRMVSKLVPSDEFLDLSVAEFLQRGF